MNSDKSKSRSDRQGCAESAQHTLGADVQLSELERECNVFSRYLLGLSPSQYVMDQYVEYHRRCGFSSCKGSPRFDKLLIRIAHVAPWSARLADSYANLFFRSSSLRKKLVLLIGILECVPAGSQHLDECRHPGMFVAAAAMILHYGGYLTCASIATLILGPIHLTLRRL